MDFNVVDDDDDVFYSSFPSVNISGLLFCDVVLFTCLLSPFLTSFSGYGFSLLFCLSSYFLFHFILNFVCLQFIHSFLLPFFFHGDREKVALFPVFLGDKNGQLVNFILNGWLRCLHFVEAD